LLYKGNFIIKGKSVTIILIAITFLFSNVFAISKTKPNDNRYLLKDDLSLCKISKYPKIIKSNSNENEFNLHNMMKINSEGHDSSQSKNKRKTKISSTEKIIWQIGKFDNSSDEFLNGNSKRMQQENLGAKCDIVYNVAESNAKINWPAYLPAWRNNTKENNKCNYKIIFNIKGNPEGTFILRSGFTHINLMSSGLDAVVRRLSILQININGHTGRAYQHPKYKNGSQKNDWENIVEIMIPTNSLRSGENILSLSAINEPAEKNIDNNSGIYFDALELIQNPKIEFKRDEVKVKVKPTIFYKNRKDNLYELVDLFLTSYSGEKEEVSLRLGSKIIDTTLVSSQSFGEQKIEFEVPEFNTKTKGIISVKTNKKVQYFPIELTPAKKWKIFMVPSIHLDIGYTDYRSKVAELHDQSLDEVMKLAKSYPDFNYSPDGFWIIQQFISNRNEHEKRELINNIHNKKIFVPAQYAGLLTGFSSLETLIRSLYPSFEFTKENEIPFNYANITDVPSYSWSYASVMASAGLKYFIAASNNGHAPIFKLGSLNTQSPFWWEGPDGGKVLMWYTKYYAQIAHVFGRNPDIEVDKDALPRLINMFASPNYKSDAILLDGSQGDNTKLNPIFASIAENWNGKYAYPKLIYSGFAEAMKYISLQFGSDIPIIKGDGGPYWEDGIASDAKYASMERETEARALSAEKLSTISSLLNPNIQINKKLDRDLWQNILLYNEHNWGSSDGVKDPNSSESIQQLKTKHLFVQNAEEGCASIIRSSITSILDDFRVDKNIGKNALAVFNTLNWKRSSLIETDIPLSYKLFDNNSNQFIPTEVVFTGNTLQKIRFETGNIPPMGYKIFLLKKIETKQALHPVRLSSNVVENKYYRLILERKNGTIKSIIDKQLNKELIDSSSPYYFGEYLYVTSNDKVPVQKEFSSELKINKASKGQIVSVTELPYGIKIVLKSSNTNTPKVISTIILFNKQKKIEFDYRIIKDKVYSKEAAYIAFPFAMDQPEFQYDTQNGVINPAKDMLPGAGQEWFSIQHYVSVSQNGVEAEIVPVNASLVTLGDIARGEWPAHFGKRKGTIFSYIMNNYWRVNYAGGQGGEFKFKYVLTSGSKIPNSGLSRFGWSEMTPFEVDLGNIDESVSKKRNLELKSEESYLDINSNDVILVNWKKAEDNTGTIMRFLEIGGKAEEVKVKIPLGKINSIFQCDAVERNIKTLPFTEDNFKFTIEPYQILTLRIQ